MTLALRDVDLLAWPNMPFDLPGPYLFVFVTIAFAIPALLIFRAGDAIQNTFSVPDLYAICAVIALTISASALLLFMLTRLDGIPRSTPIIYSLVLGAGLAGGRAFSRLVSHERARVSAKRNITDLRKVILVGTDQFAWLVIKLIESQSPATTQIMSVLDEGPSATGRSLNGVHVAGRVGDLGRIVDEYALHGVTIEAVWLSMEPEQLDTASLRFITDECDRRGIALKSVAQALELMPKASARRAQALPTVVAREAAADPAAGLPRYFGAKRVIDIVASVILMVLLAPVWLLVAALVLFDVGRPLHFWQQRVGRSGRHFFIYKFRTYHAPYDAKGHVVPGAERLSPIGRLIRKMRLDEIPQLLNVLAGEMSLIGPRPLLPADQPANPGLRLAVRPGISGWAQVNGGNLVTSEEKDALDEYYIDNASLGLDLKIAVMTMMFVFGGERRGIAALSRAMAARRGRKAPARGLAEQHSPPNYRR
ncbi:sugar transferase [Labrys sp. KB_33_2]|uniref:sugar transferase n=1 Tax=Labrys sp. KB_33_2 TaxID=3237479 RepID=UPI003F8F39BC